MIIDNQFKEFSANFHSDHHSLVLSSVRFDLKISFPIMDEPNRTDPSTPSTNQSNDKRIHELNEKFFAKTKDYLQSELELTLDDYALLEKMNLKVAEKYSDMKSDLSKVIDTLNETHNQQQNLNEYFNQFDHLEKVVNELEKKAYQIDFYSKKLENTFKQLDKSN